MIKNIFKEAKFGDKFINRTGKVFIFQKVDSNEYATLFSENSIWSCPLDGKTGEVECEFDIVSNYQEPIDEEKLDELANAYEKNINALCDFHIQSLSCEIKPSLKGSFKAGYRKAKEE